MPTTGWALPARIRSAIVVATPWGDSDSLRERRLRPGGAQPREEAATNQRARIFGAIVASTARRGYEGTRLEDLVEISGVSMRSFYELFPDKEGAFVAALEVLLERTVEAVLFDRSTADWEAGIGARLRVLGELFEAQAPAARMCLIESYVVGPRAAALVERAVVRAEGLVRERLAESPERAAMPPEMAVAAVGAVLEILRTHLMRSRGELREVMPGLLSFLLAFRAPDTTLRVAARPPEARPEAAEASDHAERALRAFEALLAEQALATVTMEQVAERASMSRRTLYANFSDRRRLLEAAIDGACAQVAAVMLPAFRRHEVPAEGLRAALGALLSFLASRPNLAHLLLLAVFEGGEDALRRRGEGLRPVRGLLRMVPAARPGSAMGGIALDATMGALLALIRRRLLEDGPAGLPALGPICTYIALAPLIGAGQATIAAEGRAYRRGSRELQTTAVTHIDSGMTHELLTYLGYGQALSVGQIAERADISVEEVEAKTAELAGLGVLEVEERDGEERLYRATLPLIRQEEWEQIDRGEQESQSAEIGRLIEIEVEEAFASGTFDSRPERNLVRIPAYLDQQGWQELNDRLESATQECLEIERRARERLTAAGGSEEGISARVYIVSFEAASGPDQH
jgi:AcrR family transcriptional regulator